jgi:uncharacterized protein YwqG
MGNLFSRFFGTRPGKPPMRDLRALTAALAAPAIHVVASAGPSRSHFGGCPQLGADLPWPERNGKKLSFLARLSLAEIQQASPLAWLPQDGALLFFYDVEQQPWGFDPKDRGGWAVLLVSDLPTQQGQPGARQASALPHRNVAFRRIEVLPSWERAPVQALDLSDEESDALGEIGDAAFEGLPKHQVSGFPAPVQGDAMELKCQLVSNGIYCGDSAGYRHPRAAALGPGAANWRLLLQIDTDDDLGPEWGDGGTLYYWIEEQEATRANFAATWLVLQCS